MKLLQLLWAAIWILVVAGCSAVDPGPETPVASVPGAGGEATSPLLESDSERAPISGVLPATAVLRPGKPLAEKSGFQLNPTPDPDQPRPVDNQETAPFYAYTHHRADGNRFVSGQGSLQRATPIDIPLAGPPQWLVAAPFGDGVLWVVVLKDGRVQAFLIANDAVTEQMISPQRLPPGMPPVLRVLDAQAGLLTSPDPAASSLTPPAVLQPAGGTAHLDVGGGLVLSHGAGSLSTIDALPDTRLLTNEDNRLLLLTGPTTVYPHGVLGDETEASGFALIQAFPELKIEAAVELTGEVIEGVAAIWTDLNGDGTREIVVTVSNIDQGARLLIFDEAGDQIAAGPAVGSGFRWRHQLAAAPFGPGGEMEIVDVLTPHIGGVVEFFRLEGKDLRLMATVPGFRSHRIGSRNLDMALAGDFDGDGSVELVVPTQNLFQLGFIRRIQGGAEVAWTMPIGGRAATNIAAAAPEYGGLALGIGREDNVLRVWTSS